MYAGNLGLERWRSLRQLADALRALGQEQGITSRLDIYSTPEQIDAHRDALLVPPITNLRGWVPSEQLPAVFHDADLLVHAESFDPAMADYTRLSFSTKLSQYMMAGRGILMFGPESVGAVWMLRAAEAGVAIGHTEPAAVQSELRPLLLDAPLRRRLGENGRRHALEWFEAQAGRERFARGLADALTHGRRRRARPCPSVSQ